MKKLLKSLRYSLRDAMRVLRADKYFICCADRYTSDKSLFYSVALTALRKYLLIACPDADSAQARFDMLTAVLDTDNSVILLTKEHARCLVSYDCQSQADFDELLNQEVL